MTEPRNPEQLAEGIERLFLLLARLRGRLGEPEPLPLTATQKLALATIVDSGPLRIRGLGELMETTEATASRTVDGLARVGLVRRKPDPEDGRGVRIEATARGRRLVEKRRAHMVGLLEELLEDMDTAEQARLVTFIGYLADALERPTAARESAGVDA